MSFAEPLSSDSFFFFFKVSSSCFISSVVVIDRWEFELMGKMFNFLIG